MAFLSKIGLQTRIVLLILVGLAVSFGLLGYFGMQAVHQSTQMVYNERLALAQNAAADIDSVITYSVADLEKMASFASSTLEGGDLDAQRKELLSLNSCLSMCHVRAAVNVSRAGIADQSGQLLWIEPHIEQVNGPSAAQSLGVQEALESGETVVKESTDQATTLEPLVTIATPLRDRNGAAIGALILELNPTLGVSALSPLTERPDTNYHLELVNEQGIVLARAGHQEQVGKPSEHLEVVVPLFEERQPGVTRHDRPQEEGKEGHVIAFAWVERVPWGVIVEQEQDVALMVPISLQRNLFLLGGIALVVVLVLAWVLTRRVVKPIKSLTLASQRIAAGNLDQPVGVSGEDEVGRLAQAFDEMRTRLKASQEEVEAWNRELEDRVRQRTKELSAIFEASQALASTLELEALLKEIMDKARDIVPSVDAGVLLVYEEGKEVLTVGASFGFDSGLASQVRVLPGGGCPGQTFSTRRPTLGHLGDLPQELRDSLSPENRSYLEAAKVEGEEGNAAMCVPLVSEERAIGGIALFRLRRPEAFSPSEVQLLQALANQAAIAMANARLFKEASMVGTLRELDRLKTEFVARASHELRTPLTSIKSLAETLLRRDLTLTLTEQREFLGGIESAADRLARIITDLLTVSRIESGRMEVRQKAVALPPLIEKVVGEFRSQTEPRAFSVIVPPDLPPAWADPDRLEDVLDNLLSNAIKYSPPDEPITVAVRVQPRGEAQRTTEEESREDSGVPAHLMVSVIDKGIGIPPQEFDKLFQRFSRVDNPINQKVRGAGLGLYICKTYVEAMGGTIGVDSSPGEGSTFGFSLPVAEEQVERVIASGSLEAFEGVALETEARASVSEGPAQRRLVLVVDDEVDVLKTAQINLTAQGFEVLTAATGREGLAMAKEQRPDVIVLDIVLPGADGLEVACLLRKDPATRDIPIVFLSARAQEEDEAEARRVGARGYVKKPFSATQLSSAVTGALGSKRRAKGGKRSPRRQR